MTAKGCVAVFIYKDGHVVASTSDFNRDGYGGCSLYESQRIRAKAALCREVMKAYCSEVVTAKLSQYQCEEIVGKLDGKIEYIEVAGEDTR